MLNIPYDIYTDASDTQLGAVITQAKRTIAFFSRKLSSAQIKYPTIDKEMLCIVEVFKEFCTILWGAIIRVWTDHINLTRQNISSQRIMTWRMLLEEFSPVFHYIKGPDNVIADTLSQFPFEKEKGFDSLLQAKNPPTTTGSTDKLVISDVLEPSDLFINYPADLQAFPLAFDRLAAAQAADDSIQATAHYTDQVFYEHTLKVYIKNNKTKIVLPQALLHSTIKWYHYILGHRGVERLIRSIATHLYSPGLKQAVTDFCKTYDACQRYKKNGPGVEHLATRTEL